MSEAATSPEPSEPKTGGPANPPRFQFSLRWLLAVPVWLALLFASIAWWGLLGAFLFTFLFCLGYALIVPPPQNVAWQFRRRYLIVLPAWVCLCFVALALAEQIPSGVGGLIFLLLFLVMIGATIALLMMGMSLPSMHWFCSGVCFLMVNIALFAPNISYARYAARRLTCNGHLKQIGLALHNYHDRFGCLPPAYVADAEGRPLYSWRVLILPYVEQGPLYDAFRLDEPWDSPNNLSVSKTPLDLFLCPSDEHFAANPRTPMTNYLAVVGPGTIWPGAESRSFADVTDGMANTPLVVEVRNCGVHWAEPRDLHVDQMAFVINPEAGQGISSAHEDGANVLFVDSTVHFLTSDLPAETLRALLTIAGGEAIGESGF